MVSKARDESLTCFGKEKCVGPIHKTVSKRGQRSIPCTNKRWWKVQNNRGSVFQRKRGVFIQRVWIRQKVLEPKKEDRTWSDSLWRLSFSAIAPENKNKTVNSGSRIHRTRAKRCKNIQPEQNLCNAGWIFYHKISWHISANKAEAHHSCWS